MSVQAVNSVNNIQQKPVQSTIEPKKPEQKESIVNGTTLLLGSLAALAVGAGIYFATRGKGGKSVTGGTSSVTDEQKPLEILKEYTLDAFKKAGHKFEKGKAITSDGKLYTGKIVINGKNEGTQYIKEYENGFLKKYTKKFGDSVKINGFYAYNKNGLIDKKLISNQVKVRTYLMKYNYKGKLSQKYIFPVETSIVYHPDGKTMKMKIFNSLKKNNSLIFNDNGDIVARIEGLKKINYLNPVDDVKTVEGVVDADRTGKRLQLTLKDGTTKNLVINNKYIGNDVYYCIGDRKGYSISTAIRNGSKNCKIDYKGKDVATFDPQTNEINLLPECGVSEEEIRNAINESKKLMKLFKKHYKTLAEVLNAHSFGKKEEHLICREIGERGRAASM